MATKVGIMGTELTVQLKELAENMNRAEGRSTIYGAINEIEQLRKLNKEYRNKILDIDKKSSDWTIQQSSLISSLRDEISILSEQNEYLRLSVKTLLREARILNDNK